MKLNNTDNIILFEKNIATLEECSEKINVTRDSREALNGVYDSEHSGDGSEKK